MADDARRFEVTEFLKVHRQNAAGQFAYRDERTKANIWIGDAVSKYESFVYTLIVYVITSFCTFYIVKFMYTFVLMCILISIYY